MAATCPKNYAWHRTHQTSFHPSRKHGMCCTFLVYLCAQPLRSPEGSYLRLVHHHFRDSSRRLRQNGTRVSGERGQGFDSAPGKTLHFLRIPQKARIYHPAGRQSEDDFQGDFLRLAVLREWLAYHIYNARRCEPKFPDLVLVRARRVLFRELKSQAGRVSKNQT